MATTEERLRRGGAAEQMGQVDHARWNDTIAQVEALGYAQNPVAPPAPRPNNFGDAAAAMRDTSVTQPRSSFGSMAVQAAQAGAPRPAAPTTPSASPSNLYMQDRAQELKDQWGQGQYAQAVGTAVRTAGQGLGMYALEAGDKLASPWLDAAKGFTRGVTGAPAQAVPASSAPPAPGGVPVAANPTDQRLAAGTQAAPMSPAAAALASPPPAAAPATPANQVMPGVFNHGRGQYSDNAAGMGMPSTFTGQPSAQNMAAADALAGRYEQAALAQPGRSMTQQAAQPGFSGVIGQQGGNGNMWSRTPEQQRRDAEVQASSIHRPTALRGTAALKSLDAESLEGVRGANSLAQEALRGQNGLAQEGMRQSGGMQREAMQQGGANQRSMMTAMLEQQKINQAGEAAGYSNRAAAQLEQLRGTLLDPKTTPEQRKQAQTALMTLQGKDARGEWGLQVTPSTKNLDGSTTQGSVYRYNRTTGEVARVDDGQNNAAPYAEGQELRGKDGRIYVVKNGQPVPK